MANENIPVHLKYTAEHEWLLVHEEDESMVTIGITHHAQAALGDITFVELPTVGDFFGAGDTFGVVESVKAASDLYMPVSGEIVAVNDALDASPETVNSDPYGAGWIVKVRLEDQTEVDTLLAAEDYEEAL